MHVPMPGKTRVQPELPLEGSEGHGTSVTSSGSPQPRGPWLSQLAVLSEITRAGRLKYQKGIPWIWRPEIKSRASEVHVPPPLKTLRPPEMNDRK
jgi:hypothetical protein